MNKKTAVISIEKYLRRHLIKYIKDVEYGTERLTMIFKGYDKCPGEIIEACIYFFSDSMECRVYSNEIGARWVSESKYKQDIYRLMNFINARIFLTTPNDGLGGMLYKPSNLYTPKIYITEDEHWDITLTTVIPYDFYELAPIETADYLTVSCPELLNQLSGPIFLTLFGKITVDEAIREIKSSILKEK
ncbi:hypothetical protein [Enterococcus cecorum]|uniref:hypothetical protein n=1 Tax=Enterococcus cecorum TaxID=44008 RepID=UPI00200AC9FB|nr:hypothetical protein [Enterococcus cecorum]